MKKINEHFVCVSCKKDVQPAPKTCRNHCPYCFTSLHVDGDVPGDRDTTCLGTMYPTAYELRNGKIKILFTCIKCTKKHWNKSIPDDDISSIDGYIKQYKKHIPLDS